MVLQPKEEEEFTIRSQEMCVSRIELEPPDEGIVSMEFRTLDVRTAEGHTLKVGVCATAAAGPPS